MPLTSATKLRAIWGVCILIVLVSYCAIVLPEHRAIERVQEQARDLYDLANRNERIAAQAPAIDAEFRRVSDEIARLAGASGSSTTARVIGALDDERRRFGVRVMSINPDAGTTSEQTQGARETLRAQDVAIELRGKFVDVVRAVADLTRGETLVGVRSIALNVVASAAEGSPELRASVTASVYALDPNWKEGNADASRSLR